VEKTTVENDSIGMGDGDTVTDLARYCPCIQLYTNKIRNGKNINI
jgi:hypothetical protein